MCHVKVSMDIKGRRTIQDGQASLRELGMRKALYDAEFIGLDRPDSRKKWIEQGLEDFTDLVSTGEEGSWWMNKTQTLK